MPILPRSRTAWPLYGVQASREIEVQALASQPTMTLMNRAGRAIARWVMALARPASPVLVVTGEGNNGGDGWVAARHLHAAGWPLRVWEVAPARAADAVMARAAALAAGVTATDAAPWPAATPATNLLAQHGLVVVDALLGLGAREPLPMAVCSAVQWIEATRRLAPSAVMVLSVDLPSGLQADTGRRLTDAQGQACTIEAQHTLSLLTLKPGLYTHEGRDCAGQVWWDDLGVEPGVKSGAGPAEVPGTQPNAGPVRRVQGAPAACARLTPSPALLQLLIASRVQATGRPRQGGHKGSFGDAWLAGGARGMRGALMLAARAALAAGAGRVHRVEEEPAGVDPSCAEVMTPNLGALEAVLKTCSQTGQSGPVLVAGCGGGRDIAAHLPEWLHRAPRLVLDADALNALACDPNLLQRLSRRSARGYCTVLTPHPLEAARLLGCSTAQVQADRLQAAQTLADRTACTVVLKGAGSIVATPGLMPWVNTSGNARLATGGTGDVLAGWIGGAWASSPLTDSEGPPSARTDPSPAPSSGLHDLVAACVHLHGLAADRCNTAAGLSKTAVLPASALIGEMARELMRAAHGQHG